MNKVYKTSAFMQKCTEKFPLEADIKSLACDGKVVYAAGNDGLFKLCVRESGSPAEKRCLSPAFMLLAKLFMP